MNTLRNNFTLLSLLCYIVEWILILGTFGLLFAGEHELALLDAVRIGALIGSILWVFGQIGRFLWNMSTGWSWKLIRKPTHLLTHLPVSRGQGLEPGGAHVFVCQQPGAADTP